MRRRIRAAAFPLHRHSLPQLAVDGALVALAYYLAFWLRFDNGGSAARAAARLQLLLERTIWWVLRGQPASCSCWRASTSAAGATPASATTRRSCARSSLIVLLSVVGIEVAAPGAIAIPHGITVRGRCCRTAWSCCSSCCACCSCAACGCSRARSTSAARWRPSAAARKGERSVLIVGAGDGGRLVLREIVRNRELGLQPVGFLDDDPRKRGCGSTACGCAATPSSELPRDPRRGRARRGDHRDPLGARAPRARASCASAARAASRCGRCRPCSSCCRPRARARSRGRCARCASRTCSAASRCRWSSSGSAPTWRARPCS